MKLSEPLARLRAELGSDREAFWERVFLAALPFTLGRAERLSSDNHDIDRGMIEAIASHLPWASASNRVERSSHAESATSANLAQFASGQYGAKSRAVRSAWLNLARAIDRNPDCRPRRRVYRARARLERRLIVVEQRAKALRELEHALELGRELEGRLLELGQAYSVTVPGIVELPLELELEFHIEEGT